MVNSSGVIFIVHKAAAPKNGVKFCQGFIGTIKSSLAKGRVKKKKKKISGIFP